MPTPARVRRLDGRMTPVDLDALEYYHPTRVIEHNRDRQQDDWMLSQIETIRVFRHPDFLFVASVMETQYRGKRKGDTFVSPFAGRLETHVVAYEVPEEGGDSRLSPRDAWILEQEQNGVTRKEIARSLPVRFPGESLGESGVRDVLKRNGREPRKYKRGGDNRSESHCD